MKKILWYSPLIKTGGIEKVTLEYLKMLKSDYEIELLIEYNLEEGNTLIGEIPNGIKYSFIKGPLNSKVTYFFRTMGKKYEVFNLFLYSFIILSDFYYGLKIKYLKRKTEYDSIISFYQFTPVYLTKLKTKKNILWMHGSVESFFKGMRKYFKKNYLNKLKKYNYIISICQEMENGVKEYFPELSNNKLKTIYNPFDFNEIKNKSILMDDLNFKEKKLLDDRYICTVSRIDENQKSIKLLIDSFSGLKINNKIKEKLYIIGDGPDKEKLTKYVKKLKLEGEILFLGRKKNPYIWIKNSKIFILSTKYEGLPTVLIEAMILDKIIVASECKTGPKEILENGKMGYLSELENKISLEKNILNALKNNEKNQEIIKGLVKSKQRFDKMTSYNNLKKLL